MAFDEKETKYRKLRLSITKIKIATTLKKFINENFKESTHFTHNRWAEYSFLDNYINYTYESHQHRGVILVLD